MIKEKEELIMEIAPEYQNEVREKISESLDSLRTLVKTLVRMGPRARVGAGVFENLKTLEKLYKENPSSVPVKLWGADAKPGDIRNVFIGGSLSFVVEVLSEKGAENKSRAKYIASNNILRIGDVYVFTNDMADAESFSATTLPLISKTDDCYSYGKSGNSLKICKARNDAEKSLVGRYICNLRVNPKDGKIFYEHIKSNFIVSDQTERGDFAIHDKSGNRYIFMSVKGGIQIGVE